MTPHPLRNFEIQSYYENEPRFIGVYSRDNLPDKIKDGAYVANLDEYSDIGTYWVDLRASKKTVTYFVTDYKIRTRLCGSFFILVLSIACLRVKA